MLGNLGVFSFLQSWKLTFFIQSQPLSAIIFRANTFIESRLPTIVQEGKRSNAKQNIDFKIQRRDSNEKITITIGLLSKTTNLHVHHSFFNLQLPFLHHQVVKMPYFPFYGDVNKQRRNLASRLNIEYVPQEFNTSWPVRYKWVGKIAIKTERAQIHLKATFSLPLKQYCEQQLNKHKVKTKITTKLNESKKASEYW